MNNEIKLIEVIEIVVIVRVWLIGRRLVWHLVPHRWLRIESGLRVAWRWHLTEVLVIHIVRDLLRLSDVVLVVRVCLSIPVHKGIVIPIVTEIIVCVVSTPDWSHATNNWNILWNCRRRCGASRLIDIALSNVLVTICLSGWVWLLVLQMVIKMTPYLRQILNIQCHFASITVYASHYSIGSEFKWSIVSVIRSEGFDHLRWKSWIVNNGLIGCVRRSDGTAARYWYEWTSIIGAVGLSRGLDRLLGSVLVIYSNIWWTWRIGN